MVVNLISILDSAKKFFPESSVATVRESNIIYIKKQKNIIANLYYDWSSHTIILKQTEKMKDEIKDKESVFRSLESLNSEIEKKHIFPKWKRNVIRFNPFCKNALEYIYIKAYD